MGLFDRVIPTAAFNELCNKAESTAEQIIEVQGKKMTAVLRKATDAVVHARAVIVDVRDCFKLLIEECNDSIRTRTLEFVDRAVNGAKAVIQVGGETMIFVIHDSLQDVHSIIMDSPDIARRAAFLIGTGFGSGLFGFMKATLNGHLSEGQVVEICCKHSMCLALERLQYELDIVDKKKREGLMRTILNAVGNPDFLPDTMRLSYMTCVACLALDTLGKSKGMDLIEPAWRKAFLTQSASVANRLREIEDEGCFILRKVSFAVPNPRESTIPGACKDKLEEFTADAMGTWEQRLVLFGKMGVGKSTLANTFLGNFSTFPQNAPMGSLECFRPVFHTSSGSQRYSVTQLTSYCKGNLYGKFEPIVVIDGQGVGEVNVEKSAEHHADRFLKLKEMRYLNMIVFMMEYGMENARQTYELTATINELKRCYGHENARLYEHFVVAFPNVNTRNHLCALVNFEQKFQGIKETVRDLIGCDRDDLDKGPHFLFLNTAHEPNVCAQQLMEGELAKSNYHEGDKFRKLLQNAPKLFTADSKQMEDEREKHEKKRKQLEEKLKREKDYQDKLNSLVKDLKDATDDSLKAKDEQVACEDKFNEAFFLGNGKPGDEVVVWEKKNRMSTGMTYFHGKTMKIFFQCKADISEVKNGDHTSRDDHPGGSHRQEWNVQLPCEKVKVTWGNVCKVEDTDDDFFTPKAEHAPTKDQWVTDDHVHLVSAMYRGMYPYIRFTTEKQFMNDWKNKYNEGLQDAKDKAKTKATEFAGKLAAKRSALDAARASGSAAEDVP